MSKSEYTANQQLSNTTALELMLLGHKNSFLNGATIEGLEQDKLLDRIAKDNDFISGYQAHENSVKLKLQLDQALNQKTITTQDETTEVKHLARPIDSFNRWLHISTSQYFKMVEYGNFNITYLDQLLTDIETGKQEQRLQVKRITKAIKDHGSSTTVNQLISTMDKAGITISVKMDSKRIRTLAQIVKAQNRARQLELIKASQSHIYG